MNHPLEVSKYLSMAVFFLGGKGAGRALRARGGGALPLRPPQLRAEGPGLASGHGSAGPLGLSRGESVVGKVGRDGSVGKELGEAKC